MLRRIKRIGRDLIFRLKSNTSQNPLQYQIGEFEAKLHWNSQETLRHAHGAFAEGEIAHEGVPIRLLKLGNSYDGLVDIGAHIGIYSVILGLLNYETPVYAYEPNPDNYELLKRNFISNDLYGEASQTAVSATGGEISFYTHPKRSVAHTAVPNNKEKNEYEQITVDSISLCDIFRTHELECPFLKIDAEGLESELINKVIEYAKNHQISGFLELHIDKLDVSRSNIIERIEGNGIHIIEVKKELNETNPGYIFSNFDNHFLSRAQT